MRFNSIGEECRVLRVEKLKGLKRLTLYHIEASLARAFAFDFARKREKNLHLLSQIIHAWASNSDTKNLLLLQLLSLSLSICSSLIPFAKFAVISERSPH